MDPASALVLAQNRTDLRQRHESTSSQARTEAGQAQTVTTPVLQQTGNQFTSLRNRTDKTPKIGGSECGTAQVSPACFLTGHRARVVVLRFHEKLPGSALTEVTRVRGLRPGGKLPNQAPCPAQVPPPQAPAQLPTVPTTRAAEALTPVLSLAHKQSESLISSVTSPCGPHLCKAICPQTASTSPQTPTGSCHLRVMLTTGSSDALH